MSGVLDLPDPWLDRAWAHRTGVQRAWTERSWAGADANGAAMLPEAGAEHLRPFTRTAQVPVVRGGPGMSPATGPWAAQDPYFAATGMFPAFSVYERPRSPLALRVAVWVTALALVAATAGLLVHQVRPQWLKALEVGQASGQPAPAAPTASHAAAGTRSGLVPRATAPAPLRGAAVRQSAAGLNSATVTVSAGKFDVLVATQAPCWVQVTSPAAFTPLFSSVMPAGTQQAFSASNGQLTVQLGASKVTLQVRIGGKVVRDWQFSPSAVPFTVNFTASSTTG